MKKEKVLKQLGKPQAMDSPEREYLKNLLLYQTKHHELLLSVLESLIPELKLSLRFQKENSVEDIQRYTDPRYDSVQRMDARNIPKDLDKAFASVQQQLDQAFPESVLRKWSQNMVSHVNSISKKNIVKAAKTADLEIQPLMKDNKLNPFFDNIVDQNIALIKSVPKAKIPHLKNALVHAISNDMNQADIAKMLFKKKLTDQNQARLIARDQVNKLNGQLNQHRQQALGCKRYIWRTSGDERVRTKGESNSYRGPNHKRLEGKTFFWSRKPITNRDKGTQNHPGQDFQCIPGYIEVGIEQPINLLYRRMYSGTLIKLTTSLGVLEITPNHPVLTQNGFLPAKDVRETDSLVQVVHPEHEDNTNVRIKIEDLYESFRVVSHVDIRQSTLRDFHGDAGHSQEIEFINALNVKQDDSKKTALYDIMWIALSSQRDTLPLWHSQLELKKIVVAIKQLHDLFRAAPLFDSSKIVDTLHDLNLILEQGELSFNESQPTLSTRSSKRKKTQPPLEVLHEIIRKIHTVPSWREQLTYCFPDAYSLDQIVRDRFSSSVSTPKNPYTNCKLSITPVLSKELIHYSGHVYNLETKSNWYIAAGSVIHNCRCHAEMILSDIVGK